MCQETNILNLTVLDTMYVEEERWSLVTVI